MGRWCVVLAGLAAAGFGLAAVGGEAPGPAVVVRPIRPDRQLEQFLGLFEGARAPHPAAALSGWRRATGRHEALSKSAQAGIALLNPAMVAELRTLDRAEFVLRGDGGPPGWFAVVPCDDGTFAALATALALTDGGAEEPLEGADVDRLGPPGSALMARAPGGLVAIAPDRERLADALGWRGSRRRALDPAGVSSGWVIMLEPAAVGSGAPIDLRRLAGAARGLGCGHAELLARLDGPVLDVLLWRQQAGKAPAGAAGMCPDWLSWIPAERTLAAACLGIDRLTLDRTFAAADGVEKADPGRAGAAPLRTRLGLLARGAGVRLEEDLWPHLRGLTAWVSADDAGEPDGALLVLHAADAAAAGRVRDRVIAPLLGRRPKRGGETGPLSSRPDIAVEGDAILIAWGAGVLERARGAHGDPGRSASEAIRSAWPHGTPARAGAFWPGRLGRRLPPELAAALAGAPPALWWGEDETLQSRDRLRWAGLPDVVRRYLDALPMDLDGHTPE